MENTHYTIPEGSYLLLPKSLAPTEFKTGLNEVMTEQVLCQNYTQAIILQKTVTLDKLPTVEKNQGEMQRLAKKYLDQLVRSLRSIFTKVSAYNSLFSSYAQTILGMFDEINPNEPSQMKSVLEDISLGIEDLVQAAFREYEDLDQYSNTALARYKKELENLTKVLLQIEVEADKLYTGDKGLIAKLKAELKETEAEIERLNACISRGAWDTAKGILKIGITAITKAFDKIDEGEKPKTKSVQRQSLSSNQEKEAIPIITGTLVPYEGDKPVGGAYVVKLQEALERYRNLIEKIEEYSREATIFSILLYNWKAFQGSFELLQSSVDSIAINVWKKFSENLAKYQTKLKEVDSPDRSLINYFKKEFELTVKDIGDVATHALRLEMDSFMPVINEPEAPKQLLLDHRFPAVHIPAIDSPQLAQRIISERSK